MTITNRFVLVAVLLMTGSFQIASAATCRVIDGAPDGVASGWNKTAEGALFGPSMRLTRAELNSRLIYPSGLLGFPLLESLYHDPKCDCYALAVNAGATPAAQIVQFGRAPRGFYRTVNGPYLELEETDSLKAVTALNGTRLLFAEVGNGDWRCVSIHESSGDYLLIDYRADGSIERLRDSFSRVVIPSYSQGRIVSLTQTWNTPGGTQSHITVVSN